MEKTNEPVIENICSTPNCGKEAKLRCPNCIKLLIKKESFFCGKDCFKNYWGKHKAVHDECKNIII